MRVLIAGASGFVGRHLVEAFAARGHEIICAGRRPPRDAPNGCLQTVTMDFAVPAADRWVRDLAGVDVVVNAIGILRETASQPFDSLHVRGPIALFAAASAAGIRRVIQISALGADARAQSRYHRSKHEADRVLMESSMDWVIVQPSLVYGPGGTSARLFDMLAALPIIPLPAGGLQMVQPVHIDDLADVVVHLAEDPASLRCVLPVVGPRPLTLKDFLLALRQALGLGVTATLRVPRACMNTAARLAEWIPGMLLTRETLAMLERGNTASAAPLAEQLGHAPRDVARFVPGAVRLAARTAIATRWVAPLLRLAIAAMWLIAGIVSLGFESVQGSVDLLASIGIPVTLAPLTLFGAAGLDLVFGVWTLLPWRPRALWSAQIVLVVLYTLVITLWLPQLWLEPFGPVAKNLPILAALLLLRQIEATPR
jgi:uncharacterized protein YbjT (DUF2867 family)/uncharacterized membrane protein YphA (DoxX/SURF4 family)